MKCRCSAKEWPNSEIACERPRDASEASEGVAHTPSRIQGAYFFRKFCSKNCAIAVMDVFQFLHNNES